MINGLDLFSGIGGITLALNEWVKPVAYCEIDKYAQAVLRSRIADGRLPDAPILNDVKEINGTEYRGKVDIIYGGFPCQDISSAGNGRGLAGERSGLFFEIVRLVKDITPTFIFLENVPTIRLRGLSEVGHQLANSGYDCRWTTLSAQEVGAPHKRERWFLLAHANNSDGPQLRRLSTTNEIEDRSKVEYKNEPDKFSDAAWWDTEPSVDRVVDGLSFRLDRNKCLGNGVVPLQVKEAFKELMGI